MGAAAPTHTPSPTATNTPDPDYVYVPQDYSTIQTAVDAANAGMTVVGRPEDMLMG